MNNNNERMIRPIYPKCVLPSCATSVWRYMDIDKFTWMLQQKALYLTRVDRLQDKFEGTYSRVQLSGMNQRFLIEGLDYVVAGEKRFRAARRKSTFVFCWTMAETDMDLMWKGFLNDKIGVSIRSSVGRLIELCDSASFIRPLDISMVKYVDLQESQIDYTAIYPFLHKDKHFALENELRLLHWPTLVEPPPEYMKLPIVQMSDVIEEVVLKPGACRCHVACVRTLMDTFGLQSVPLTYSRYDKEQPEP
ncbi:MAG: hypothetical protein WCH61_02370 [bacterium]